MPPVDPTMNPVERFRAWCYKKVNQKTIFQLANIYGGYKGDYFTSLNGKKWVLSHLKDIDRYLIEHATAYESFPDKNWKSLWVRWLKNIKAGKKGSWGMKEPLTAVQEEKHYATKRRSEAKQREPVALSDILKGMKDGRD